MSKAIIIEGFGSSDVLDIVDVTDPSSGLSDWQVVVENKVIGINRFEVEQRQGISILAPKLPAVLGVESVGIVKDIGLKVRDFQIGDRVGCFSSTVGSYCKYRVVDQGSLMKLPDSMSFEDAAACLFKGINAHYLLYKVNALAVDGAVVLVHNVVDGIGYFLAQYAKFAGHLVIGTVSSDEDIHYAKSLGCFQVLNYHDPDFVPKVMEVTKGLGVAVVYDSVGKDVMRVSLECLGLFGVYIVYGQSSGPVLPINPKVLGGRSLFVTYTSIFHYKRWRFELAITAAEVFRMVNQSIMIASIGRSYLFEEARKAHADLEDNKVRGSSIMVP